MDVTRSLQFSETGVSHQRCADFSSKLDLINLSTPVTGANQLEEGHSIILLLNVAKTYHSGSWEEHALRGVNLEVNRGEHLAILGPSGSGKSTLLNIIGGIDRPTSGEVVVADNSLGALKEEELAFFRRKTIGFVFQLFNLIPSFTALENVMLPLELAQVKSGTARSRAGSLLEEVGLRGKERHLPSELSIGEQQRVAIARALANDPPIILADEPTGNLDRELGLHIIELLLGLSSTRGTTLVIVTHNHEVAAKADRTLELVDGKFKS